MRLSAAATTADDICPGDANPCIVRGNVRADSGSVIDVGGRDLLISEGATLSVSGGDLTLRSGRLTIQSRAAVRAQGSASVAGGTIDVSAGFISVTGRVEASGSPGGSITIESTGELVVTGVVDVSSRSRAEDGGSISLSAASITLSGPVTADGGREGTGGDIDISATGSVLISRNVEATGADGGIILVAAGANGGGNLTVTSSGRILAEAQADDGSGGDIELSADGDGVIFGHIAMNGLISAPGGGNGGGGCINVSAAGNILGVERGAQYAASGGRLAGDGGEVSFTTFVGRLETLATVAAVGHNDGRGGEITFDIAGPVQIVAPLNANGGRQGGSVDGSSGGDITVTSTIRADGGTAGEASINLEGCTILIDTPGTVASLGPNGANRLVGHNLTVIRGKMLADPESGRNEIIFGSERRPPLIFESATVNPAALQVRDSNLQVCGADPLATPTATPTGIPTPTPPAVCAGDCDEDGTVAVNELVLQIAIALEHARIEMCPAGDPNRSGRIEVDELMTGIHNALQGCPVALAQRQ
jgi:hypothetical protein